MTQTTHTGDPVDALSFVCHKMKAEAMGRRVALKLKEVIDRQNFEINIQVGPRFFLGLERHTHTHLACVCRRIDGEPMN